MKLHTCTFLLIVFSIFCSCSENESATKIQLSYFEKVRCALDSIDYYNAQFKERLQFYKNELSRQPTKEIEYYYNKKIAEGYYTNNPDSAVIYVKKCKELSSSFGFLNSDLECILQEIHIANIQGFLEISARKLKQAQTMTKPTIELKRDYYLECMQYWNQRAMYYELEYPDPIAKEFADSLLLLGDSISRGAQLFALYVKKINTPERRDYLNETYSELKKFQKDDEWYSLLNLLVGWSEYEDGNTNLAVKCLSQNLMTEISKGSLSLPMLPVLGGIAMKLGELETAQAYMEKYIEIQKQFPERIRSASNSLNPMIISLGNAIQDQKEHYANNLSIFTLILAMASIVILLFLFYIHSILRKEQLLQITLEDNLKQLNEQSIALKKENEHVLLANNRLAQQEKLLREQSKMLKEANFLKEEYIGRIFSLCSEYQQKITAVKLDIHRKVIAHQYEQIFDMTNAKNGVEREKLHELWNQFDAIFIQIFPDFVGQFNALLKPEGRINLRKGEKLNTDLRIFAMIRLGITSSIKICSILGLSAQTVYNARKKYKDCALDSEEEFTKRVKSLCRSSNSN